MFGAKAILLFFWIAWIFGSPWTTHFLPPRDWACSMAVA